MHWFTITDERALGRGKNGDFTPKRLRVTHYEDAGERRILLRAYSQRRGNEAPLVLDLALDEYLRWRDFTLQNVEQEPPARVSRFHLLHHRLA